MNYDCTLYYFDFDSNDSGFININNKKIDIVTKFEYNIKAYNRVIACKLFLFLLFFFSDFCDVNHKSQKNRNPHIV